MPEHRAHYNVPPIVDFHLPDPPFDVSAERMERLYPVAAERADFESAIGKVTEALVRMSIHCQTLIDLLSEHGALTEQGLPTRIDGVFLATHLHEVGHQLRRFTVGLTDSEVAAVLRQNEAILRGGHGVL